MNTPAITMTPVESSQIEAYGYDHATQTLAIQFKGKPGKDGAPDKPGAIYHYGYVGPTEWAAFSDAASKGGWFFANIKPYPGRYPFTRQPEPEVEA